MSEPDLKPCPFCGGDAVRWKRENGGTWQHAVDHWISCDSDTCLVHVGMCETEEQADVMWNTRAEAHQLP